MTRMRNFEYADYGARYQARSSAERWSWPVEPSAITRIGDAVTSDRGGGRPHKGIDVFVPSGTAVVAAKRGTVLRVVDGRYSTRESARRAGLFVDVLGSDSLVYRYLHLGDAAVRDGQTLTLGDPIGSVAPANTSGLAERPHLHFEVRASDYERARRDYGAAINPLRVLPTIKLRA